MGIRPLIVGEAPNRACSGEPVGGRIGARLAECAGMPFEQFALTFARTNVLDYWPGTDGKGAVFPRAEARAAVENVLARIVRQRRTVILLGKRVAYAFGYGGLGYFDRARIGHATIVVVPHPSGVNRWWNQAKNRARMRRFMRRIAEGSE